MKIDNDCKEAIDYFLTIDDEEKQQKVLEFWQRWGFTHTLDDVKNFVEQSKEMLSSISNNTEINSPELKTILAVACFDYAKKLGKDISNCNRTEMSKIGNLRNKKLGIQAKAMDCLKSLSTER